MIYTLTLSPSIDYSVGVKNFTAGIINRTYKEDYVPGGKGINVSIVLKNLGFDSIALGFLAGFTGDFIEAKLKEEGLNTSFVRTGGITRINVKVESEDEKETAINGQGPRVTQAEMAELLTKIGRIQDNDVLIMSGQVPPTLPSDTYETILQSLKGKRILTVVDSTGKLLTDSLKYHPFLVKPNGEELAGIVGRPLPTNDDIIEGAKELRKMGAQNALISLGKDGAILVDSNDQVWVRPAMKGHAVSTVGAGDSMVAGFIAGYLESHDYGHALELGLSSGSATAFSKGLATKEAVEKIMKTMYNH